MQHILEFFKKRKRCIGGKVFSDDRPPEFYYEYSIYSPFQLWLQSLKVKIHFKRRKTSFEESKFECDLFFRHWYCLRVYWKDQMGWIDKNGIHHKPPKLHWITFKL